MSKDYKGYELVKAIHDKEIEDGSKIEVHSLRVGDNILTTIEYKNFRLNWKESTFSTGDLFDDNIYFRVIEEKPEIDIQGIKDMERYDDGIAYGYKPTDIGDKINELIKAIKQLDKQIKEK